MSRKTFLFTSRIVATFLRKNIAGALQAVRISTYALDKHLTQNRAGSFWYTEGGRRYSQQWQPWLAEE
jgi:hypothetical protein